MDDTSVTDLTESTSKPSVNWLNLINLEPSSWQNHTVDLPSFGLEGSESTTKSHQWILRTFINLILCCLKNKNNRVYSFNGSDIFEPFAPCCNRVAFFPHLQLSRFIMMLFLSVALPKFPANWVCLWQHVSTQAEEIQDFCSVVLCHYIYDVPVQLHFPGPITLLLQASFPLVRQLFLQRVMCLSTVHDGAGGWPLVRWALQSVHPPSDDQGEQRPLWWNL